MKKTITLIFIVVFVSIFVLHPHSGRTDANGGHVDRKTGKYHYHNKYASESKSNDNSYNRDSWKHWIDEDKDGQDTRVEVLIEESLVPVTFNSKGKVIKGEWYNPYTDKYFTNAIDLDIDHFVPLKYAHDMGGMNWSDSKKEKYANYLDDPNHLIAVSIFANRSKGAKSPREWLPPNEEYRCEYISIWISIKEKWDLRIDDEVYALTNIFCED